ncbi:hypothetical protein SARC_09059 [Sphaeroforma arctica JP610]|uniref:SAC domain-containing protein n=1 Tax=Sphaeroforma arctica JP610 TaxID=667725 RepID=A0A0L0FP48_9EUKA|nr:hypothetical protein SARC_09059 [Sphaeroforma arctica JP610]KNC78514.1 hypothetical protein SARC_09059 [Sphaeroforma arctica JP610]|eukprot:XP_014152416.1 hypothetical protein SARC_09059 [Sphaeroforma arctica JP610]
MLPDTLNIYIEENTFRLEPLFSDHRKSPHWAEIDRVTHTIKPVEAAVLSGHNVRCVHGVLGVLRLPSGPVLLVVTAKSAIAGRVRGHTLWRVNDVDYIRYNVYATPEEVQRDAEYVDMLKWLINFTGPPCHSYNDIACRPPAHGRRYNCRGINSDGDVANFCEVEQIVQSHGLTGSYVQVRGSIPLFWQQQVDIRYKPSITFPVQDMKNETSFVKHMDKLLQTYGKVVLVDLIDQNGAELALGNKFRSLVKAYKNEFVRYIGFDFHKECKGMQWGKLSMLQSDLMPDLENDG